MIYLPTQTRTAKRINKKLNYGGVYLEPKIYQRILHLFLYDSDT